MLFAWLLSLIFFFAQFYIPLVSECDHFLLKVHVFEFFPTVPFISSCPFPGYTVDSFCECVFYPCRIFIEYQLHCPGLLAASLLFFSVIVNIVVYIRAICSFVIWKNLLSSDFVGAIFFVTSSFLLWLLTSSYKNFLLGEFDNLFSFRNWCIFLNLN